MSADPTPNDYDWDQLASFAKAGRELEQHDRAERDQLRQRLDQALERVRALERELEGLRDDL